MHGNRLLVIDDEPAVGKTIKTIASGCGYEVKATVDAVGFLDQLSRWHPTHIALDLQMPVVDGIELMRIMGTRRCPAKIVIISGFEGRVVETARQLGLERGLNIAGVLLKPFRAAELRHLLDQLAVREDWNSATALAEALSQDALFLAYQPKIDLATQRIVGFEGLARWQHPRHGLLLPDRFIPLAESAGMIDRLIDRVIDLGLRQLAQWGGSVEGTLSLNLSARNVDDLSFVDRLRDRCAAHDVPTSRLVLELTESSAMADPVRAMDILARLRLKGFRLSLDDFGAGYSSLLQLARLPFSELKIDSRFVRDCDRSPEARAIVKSTIDLSHNLGLRAVAEGVESAEILQLLTELGCDLAQGYYIGKPIPAAEVPAWIEHWTARVNETRQAADAPLRAKPISSAWSKNYDGSDDTRAALTQALADRINPLWGLGRNSLVGWRPADDGIDVLMVPYHDIVDRFAESQRLLHGKRLMGDRTFHTAQELAGCKPAHVPLPFRIADDEPGAVPTDVIEHVLRRYGITETRHRAVALFDIVSFSRLGPRVQVAQLNSLECSINTAQGIMLKLGKPIDLARTTTGDGFYIWNREKGAQADLDTYLLSMLVVAENAIARHRGREDFVPELRTCFSVGPHYSYYQVDGLDPKGHDYIVGDVTIGLARMISKCLPGQILIGDFSRPEDETEDPTTPVEFVIKADGAFANFNDVELHGHTVRGIRCYLTGEGREEGGFDVARFRIRDKHGFDHHVFNQKFNIYLNDTEGGTRLETLLLGKPQGELADFEADPTVTAVAAE
jgi:EAL domain-containing protein (putative c-di-GMP-specific phosphodiesterase class I)